MVVAAGAVDRHAAVAREHLREHVVEVVCTGLTLQHVALRLNVADEIPRPGGQEASGDHCVGIVGRQDVAGDLLAEKLVVGLVGVERLDHIVAIPPGIGAELITLEAVGVGVVGDVEPVAGPAFAVVGRSEQAIDELFIGIGRFVGDKRGHFLGRGRQAEEVERQPADERAAIGLRGRHQLHFSELELDEPVDVVPH